MFLDVMRFHIQTDPASDLSTVNVDHLFPIDAVNTPRNRCTATAGTAFVLYCIPVDKLVWVRSLHTRLYVGVGEPDAS